jgi:tRNA nucleotidyltransferase/poly(A) polymerase
MSENMERKSQTIYDSRLKEFHREMEQEASLSFIKELAADFPNGEIYLVGGAVRDAAMGETKQKDYDFVVRNVSAENLEKFLSEHGDVVLVGKNFGVYKFVPHSFKLEEPIDVALPRTEHSLGEGGGYRDFKIQSDPEMPIEKDLSRRDFTINAMAWDLKSGKLVDPFHGLEDLEAKIIKAVGEPKERFREDYSRMLRALRFAAQFGFKIEEKTFEVMKEMIKHINDERQRGFKRERVVPHETIAKEFLKTFWHNSVRAFDLYDESGAFRELMPEMMEMKGCPQPPNFHSEGDVWIHTRMALENLQSKEFKKQFGKEKPSAEVVIAVMFHDLGKPLTIKTPERDGTDRIRFDEHDVRGGELAGKICRRLKLDSLPEGSLLRVEPSRVKQMIGKHMLLLQGDIEAMRNSTIEKYFFNPNFPGKELLQLTFADALATIPKDGKPNLDNFYAMVGRIEKLKELVKERERLPAPVLNGEEIMEKFKLKPGPKVGELIAVLREAQLSGEVGTPDEPLEERKKKGFEVLEKYLKEKES